MLRNYRLEIDNLGKFAVEYTEKKEKARKDTQHLPLHFVHQDYIIRKYATAMQGVTVMMNLLGGVFQDIVQKVVYQQQRRQVVGADTIQELSNVCS